MTAEMVGNWILERTPKSFQVGHCFILHCILIRRSEYLVLRQKMLSMNYSFGFERDEKVLARNDFDPRKWTNPLEIRYPENYLYDSLY